MKIQKIQQTHRYFTIPHKMKRVESLTTGAYLNAESQKNALNPAITQKIEIENTQIKDTSETTKTVLKSDSPES